MSVKPYPIDLTDADNHLVWPRELFVREADAVRGDRSAEERLLEEAFRTPLISRLPTHEADPWGTQPLERSPSPFEEVVSRTQELREWAQNSQRFYRSRQLGTTEQTRREPDLDGAQRAWCRYVGNLDVRKYFDYAFTTDCVDAPREVDPGEVMLEEIGAALSWPPSPVREARVPGSVAVGRWDEDEWQRAPIGWSTEDAFFTLVEWVFTKIARPRKGSIHTYSGCGFHPTDFSRQTGKDLYRLEVNRIFTRHGLPFELASGGQQDGWVISRTDAAREEVAATVLVHLRGSDRSEVEETIAMFRRHDSTRETKRAAVTTLARLLEARRAVLKEELLTKDEGDLFHIANKFDLRHSNERQKSDYRTEFMDWTFWWYLATIELVERLTLDASSTSR